MEYGYTQPEVVSVEERERRSVLVGKIGIRTYQIQDRLAGQDDLPIARQFSAYDLHLAAEEKQSISLDIPGQQILPIEFS